MNQPSCDGVDRQGTQPARVGLLLLAGLAVAFAGCSSGGGSGGGLIGGPITASFTPSDTAGSPDLVRLTGDAASDLVTLQVTISGQTASDDLYAFVFDLVLSNPDVASYVDGSAEFGSALTLEPGEDGVALAAQEGNRVTVGVSKLGTVAGNGVGPEEEIIVTLGFRVTNRASTTIAFDQTPPAAPTALESDEDPAPGVSFDGAAALISGS